MIRQRALKIPDSQITAREQRLDRRRQASLLGLARQILISTAEGHVSDERDSQCHPTIVLTSRRENPSVDGSSLNGYKWLSTSPAHVLPYEVVYFDSARNSCCAIPPSELPRPWLRRSQHFFGQPA